VQPLRLPVDRGAARDVGDDLAHNDGLFLDDDEGAVGGDVVAVGDGPPCLAFLSDRCRPARVLSAMFSRSYSAKEASIWKMSLPDGVEVSMGSRPERKATPSFWSLSWASTMTSSLRPSLSSL
ncbi:MAG TPA: hypothetical protein VHF70_01535, partial [Rubrobacteraceae bacterium]|nr:hypothetical protein [Rubrobacteraceae bacterium]